MQDLYAFVGMAWWGMGPRDMARAMSDSQEVADYVEIWNIKSRLDRLLMRSRGAASLVARRRLRTGLSGGAKYRAIFVVSPHRFTYEMLLSLRSRSNNLVAVLGDEPTSARAVTKECWALFDLVASADQSWLSRLEGYRGARVVMPWGSTINDASLLAGQMYRPAALILVGAPYQERVTVAENLARRYDVVLQGSNWPAVVGARRRDAASREETLFRIRENRELVVNIHHAQFSDGHNPQFFDYAAAGIPQLVMRGGNHSNYSIGMPDSLFEGSLDEVDLLGNRGMMEANSKLVETVRANYMFRSCVERVLDAL